MESDLIFSSLQAEQRQGIGNSWPQKCFAFRVTLPRARPALEGWAPGPQLLRLGVAGLSFGPSCNLLLWNSTSAAQRPDATKPSVPSGRFCTRASRGCSCLAVLSTETRTSLRAFFSLRGSWLELPQPASPAESRQKKSHGRNCSAESDPAFSGVKG